MADRCATPTVSRRKTFWTTQPDACGTYVSCGDECGNPGLVLQYPPNCNTCGCQCKGPVHDPNCLAEHRRTRPDQGLTFATNDWVRGLLLNILNTYARDAATACGVRPGSQGGHWSESYMNGQGAGYIGTRIYKSQGKAYASIQQAVAMLRAALAVDAQKLVVLGVARAVEVEVEYVGGSKVSATITIYGPGITTGVVNLSAKLLENSWVWQ